MGSRRLANQAALRKRDRRSCASRESCAAFETGSRWRVRREGVTASRGHAPHERRLAIVSGPPESQRLRRFPPRSKHDRSGDCRVPAQPRLLQRRPMGAVLKESGDGYGVSRKHGQVCDGSGARRGRDVGWVGRPRQTEAVAGLAPDPAGSAPFEPAPCGAVRHRGGFLDALAVRPEDRLSVPG